MECEASWSVETVGAIDRAPAVGGARPSIEDRSECLSSDVALPLRAVEKEYALPLTCGPVLTLPDCGYGLFILAGRFLACILTWCRFEFECRPSSPDDELLKFVSFFTQVEKGRRRPERSRPSSILSVSQLGGGAQRICFL
jgi:hypothetical protein